MGYTQSLAKSADRHLKAAEVLADLARTHPEKCRSVAGYLFGVAAECAVKEIMRTCGIRPLPNDRRRDDPYYAHFPELKTMLRDNDHGRRSDVLRRIVEDAGIMAQWNTDMRYAPAADVQEKWIDRWAADASDLVSWMHGS